MDRSLKIRTFIIGLAACIASSTPLLSAKASTVTADLGLTSIKTTSTTPTHAIFLKCKVSDSAITQSKGAILSLPGGLTKSKIDFALVTGHGLHPHSDCFISDFQGNSKEVLTKTFAKGYKAGTETDWAVVSFKRIKGEHIRRYSLDGYLENPSSLHNAPISFAKARGLPQNDQKCKIAVLASKTIQNTDSIYSHDCRAIPGQSGSPLTQNLEGRHHLIGLHLGHLWLLESPLTGKPGQLNILTPYDKKMSEEIKQAIRDLK